ncbi:hypothetical protein [Nakamurella multipartita]|uniref:PspA domain-containing protein n=1 Tax=Nakamurella multipartita (strain ATCC 700099 / DSM 44233 / CIP 104796 / JCM 9543 / NBRC 105858 / Y-104) TaxID=479431 RepID=C8XD51_NAKMY|nr:hypothetical protein [Nakamurella multipartita]ACV81541.1 hypothetical protein Namu_5275 [Nakamurella multipartita DSM 44233]
MADEHAPEPEAAAVVPVTPVPVTPVDSGPAAIVAPPPDYSAGGVPSLDFVRDKIEGRFARSLGSAELAGETPEARSAAEQQAEREKAAQDKLAAIRNSLRGSGSGT